MRLIDADELLEKYESYGNTSPIALTFIDDLNEMPTVEQKHGHWEKVKFLEGTSYPLHNTIKSSVCGYQKYSIKLPLYCEHCGAKMDEEVEE